MKRNIVGVAVICGLLGVGLAGIVMANGAVEGDPWGMMVSPSTIVLAKISALTVHTNIPFGLVVPGSVDLDGVAPSGIGRDSLGHIVLKFALADLDLAPGDATLTLSGDLTTGTSFSETDDVRVK
jgi:hypothetical protein